MADLTSYWVFLQQHRQKASAVIAGILLFVAGWQLGRVTSPFYAANPIVFQDRPGSGSGGSLTELQALGNESAALGQSKTTQAVAGASTTTQGTYVASVNSTLFHHKDCASAKRINEENKIWFTSPQDAQDAGYTPSACAKEKIE